MTPEAQRIAIAEAVGWKRIPLPATQNWGEPATPEKEWWYLHQLPDYLNSLDAMHDAEKVLTRDQESDYVYRLADAIMESAYEDDSRYLDSRLSSSDSTYRCTAAQRAEAFLKCLGKWTD